MNAIVIISIITYKESGKHCSEVKLAKIPNSESNPKNTKVKLRKENIARS